MPIHGTSAAVAVDARREARGGGDDAPWVVTTGESAPVARGDEALAGGGAAQGRASPGPAGALEGAARVTGPLTYRRGALAGVPQGLERGKRLDVRV